MILAFSFFQIHCVNPMTTAVTEIMNHRKKQEDELRDPKKSPLEKRDRKRFKGLNYYDIDLSYRVKVKFVKTENPVLFQNEDDNVETTRIYQIR